MALNPQKFREIVFQLLYLRGFAQDEEKESVAMVMAEFKVTRKAVLEALEKAKAIEASLAEIDPKIEQASTGYDFQRISGVEKCCLRLATFEVCYGKDVPPLVSIAEAVRLTKKFSAPESAPFVNAVLDEIFHGRNKPQAE
ncbi:MAG: putative transcription antitermination factor, NusB family [Chlamydiota bacterium]|jgi:N utilization substance protein B